MEVIPEKEKEVKKMSEENGLIYRISGPVVTAVGITPRMYEVVRVGDEGLMGEVIELHGDCLLYTSPSPRDRSLSRMPSSA